MRFDLTARLFGAAKLQSCLKNPYLRGPMKTSRLVQFAQLSAVRSICCSNTFATGVIVLPRVFVCALGSTSADVLQIADARRVHQACGTVSKSNLGNALETAGAEVLYRQARSPVSIVKTVLLRDHIELWVNLANARVGSVKVASLGVLVAPVNKMPKHSAYSCNNLNPSSLSSSTLAALSALSRNYL
jgi:hypothetical protein